MTRLEKKQRRQEVVALLSIAAIVLLLVWFGFELRGALEAAAW